MPNVTPRKYVAIIGGIMSRTDVTLEDLAKVGREFGAELAKAGFGLVVYFSDEQSLEPHVVRGYVENAPANSDAAIRVRFSDKQRDSVLFAEEATHAALFARQKFPLDEWQAPFYRSLAESGGVDAVLLVAGGNSVCIAGQIAIARGLPVLACDKFNGSAKEICKELALKAGGSYPSYSSDKESGSVDWLRQRCDERAKQDAALESRARQIALQQARVDRILSKNRKAILTFVSFLVLAVITAIGIAYPTAPSQYGLVVIAGMVAGGATGAFARDILWNTETKSSAMSLALGCIAGFVVGLSYLIPQWVGAHGFLDQTATVVAAEGKIQFASAVLVAISAGVGFDAIFNNLKRQADTLPIGTKP